MPKHPGEVTITAHVTKDANFTYEGYSFLLEDAGIRLTKHEIFERIMLGLSKKHIRRLCCLNWRHGRLRAGVV